MKNIISFTGILKVVLLLLLTCSILAFFDSYLWIGDLAVHFRLHYLGLAILAIIPAFLIKGKTHRITVLIVMLLNIFPLLPYLFKTADSNITGSKITLFHCNLLSSNNEFDLLKREVLKDTPSIVLLEEFTEEWQENMEWLRRSHPYFKEVPQSDNFGIALYSNTPLNTIYEKDFSGIGIATLIAEVTIDKRPVRIIGTHPVPPAGKKLWKIRNSQIEAIATEIVLNKALPTIVLGDFNATPWSSVMREFSRRSSLQDSQKRYLFQSSWRSGIPLLNIPIDNCYFSREFTILSRRIGAPIGSDHLPLKTTLSFKEKEIGVNE